ncbi:hypothetical protein PP715_11765 [Ralstonia solanacearum]|nr:hypothetical protein [Ralstonia solanacearum]MCG3574951.1 hypothetical protein [Ralstonia solanacearum]MCL9824223.1 hypothetical protein [Ralstonia solanacearum]MCL9829441.1 hypothetical protein [Ralstonia solanacearum]MCL9834222.1 hypothetical protein [Ralstonia solanacearum]MCL9839384.1 hypothetical protein [Ralstonia solanacearum]
MSLPMHGVAVLLGLAAAGCLYAAAPNQLLLPPAAGDTPPVSRRRACLLLAVAAAALAALAMQRWSVVLDIPAAVAATLLVLTGGLSLWPLLGALVHGRRTRSGRAHP